jgi:hypothetical protein
MKIRNIALDVVLTLLLCGLWNIVVQYSQIETLNQLLKEEKYSLLKIGLLSLITCGLYWIYFEYCKAKDVAVLQKQDESQDTVLAVVLTLFGLSWVFDAILQNKLNEQIQKEGMPQAMQS